MKIIVRYNHWLPKMLKDTVAITLYPFVLYAEGEGYVWSESTVVEHETVHVRQIRKLGVFRFYVTYWIEYFCNRYLLGMSEDDAYENVSFEKEAYATEEDVVLTKEEMDEYGYEYE